MNRRGPDENETGRSQAVALRTAIAALVRRFSLSERADVSCCGLTVAQAALLDALRGGQPVRLSALAKRLGITPSTLTRNLEKLETEGLVERRSDPEDGRAAQAKLTSAGKQAASRVAAQEEAFAAEVLDRLGPRSGEVMRALGHLLDAVRGATERCCPGAFDHLMEGVAGARPVRRNRERRGCCTN